MPRGRTLLLAAALALLACGGNPEKQGLRSYEAVVEDLMTEDEGVSARLKDLREDFESASGPLEDQVAYGKEQALPFYRRFREAAAKAPVKEPRLAKIHSRLLEFLDRRIGYVEGTATLMVASRTESMARFRAAYEPYQSVTREVTEILQGSGGRITDRETAEAMTVAGLFMERVYGPFTRGQAQQSDVETGLRVEVMPRLGKLIEKTKDQRTAQGIAGAVARWAKAQDAFFREMATTLPEQQALHLADARNREDWAEAESLRTKYIEELRAYRESLR